MSKKTRRNEEKPPRLKRETVRSIWAIALLGVAMILVLAGFAKAGPAGEAILRGLTFLVGWGYPILPIGLLLVAGVLLTSGEKNIVSVAFIGAGLMMFALLGLIEILSPTHGGVLGLVLGALKFPFGREAAVLLNILIAVIGFAVMLDFPIKISLPKRKETNAPPPIAAEEPPEKSEEEVRERDKEETEVSPPIAEAVPPPKPKKTLSRGVFYGKNYVPPPQTLLKSANEKPTTGDLRANANIIKRTLESFGIPVEMGEIHIGPKVTRYTLKPAEGVKLSRITALGQDLALALAAHPIRIEAPIPGKSLVGIEVPNKAAALVRLGNLMAYPEFQSSGMLSFALGRDVTGEPVFPDIERMPHLLIAGATGSGKSITIHSLIISLLYKNSPATMKLILVDPKRVELSIYEGIPHLITPVITDNKKTIAVFRWAIKEMERRYDILLQSGSRDIKSYNANSGTNRPLPFLIIVIDELADLMASYGREVEGSIVRLAQMARATGLHLVLSTQRPSVEVITGLIKANITSRIALQVASQVDSRTILDAAGAEKLLGAGDLLFISSELSKPKRIQGSYISEEEVKSVADFIREHNQPEAEEAEELEMQDVGESEGFFEDFLPGKDDDELYYEALRVVREAKKASASLLQRRLRVGYARAARLLDLMEERGAIGPGEGAKPRDVYLDRLE